MFHPMAMTVVLALTSAMLLSLTFVPASIALFLGGRSPTRTIGSARDPPRYELALRWSIRTSRTSVDRGRSARGAVWIARDAARHGVRPGLDEGDIAVHALRIPGTSLSSRCRCRSLEHRFAAFPEVERVFSRIGTADVANDPMPPSMTDTFVMSSARRLAGSAQAEGRLVEEIEPPARHVPGSNYEFTQPIQMRMNELLSGVRADVAVKVYRRRSRRC